MIDHDILYQSTRRDTRKKTVLVATKMRREKNMYVQICAIGEGQLVEREREREKIGEKYVLYVDGLAFFSIHMSRESVRVMKMK